MKILVTKHIKDRLEERINGHIKTGETIELEGELEPLGWKVGPKGLRKDFVLYVSGIGNIILTDDDKGWVGLTYLYPNQVPSKRDYMSEEKAIQYALKHPDERGNIWL